MKADTHAGYSGAHLELIAASEASSRAIPPLWPLSSSVAVNPFLGQTGQTLTQTSALLGRVAGTSITMPKSWYRTKIESGTITDADLTAAVALAPGDTPCSVDSLKKAARIEDEAVTALPTVADLAAEVSGIDWPGLIADRIGSWASGYFDTGQALWQTAPGRDAFQSWQTFASRDLTPEITGLGGFAAMVAATPRNARTALLLACEALDMDPLAARTYFHQLLLGLGGWSQLARQKLWQAELAGGTDEIVTDILAIRLTWEKALFEKYQAQIKARWADTCTSHARIPQATDSQIIGAILQEAAERAAQRELAEILSGPGEDSSQGRPALQAAFCIDVRSEVFRRALESLDPGIRTSGFAGFFGLTTAHRDFASDVEEMRLPVLLNNAFASTSASPETAEADTSARLAARAVRAWGRFKLAAVSSFAFVEATGPLYVGKLTRDALGMTAGTKTPSPVPHLEGAVSAQDRINAANGILRAMSMTGNFAPLVLLVGHGANVVNNPHASALHCGACGGYAGDVNARLLAGLLNDPEVRKGLVAHGIEIPGDTMFIGALHDTTTDAVTVFEADFGQTPDRSAIAQAKEWLGAAGQIARMERAARLPYAPDASSIASRSTDWAEIRPEWALAGCNAFIATSRSRTRGKKLGGRAFLHDYDWKQDQGFGVLELILTAPVVVASWISLQYYGSVVAPDLFGAGNKLLHNVTGGIGVVEGNGGLLRTGLPWQSVHDGLDYAHDPLRLSVCIEAPADAVTDILDRHPDVRALFDNRWLHLLLLNENGQIAARYCGDLEWEPFDPARETDISALARADREAAPDGSDPKQGEKSPSAA